MKTYYIEYICPHCAEEWDDYWDSAVDAECPKCGVKHISPIQYEEV